MDPSWGLPPSWDNKILFIPGKAANAGGVAVSGLEMAQNSQWIPWTFEKADTKLKTIVIAIYRKISEAAEEHGYGGNFVAGANIAGFIKVANAMPAQELSIKRQRLGSKL